MKSDVYSSPLCVVRARKWVLIVANSVENDAVYVEIFIATIFPEIYLPPSTLESLDKD